MLSAAREERSDSLAESKHPYSISNFDRDASTAQRGSLRSPRRSAQHDRISAPYVPRIQTPRHCRVGGAFDDGAAVGEQRHLVGVVPEFQDEIVVPDDAVSLKSAVHLGEV